MITRLLLRYRRFGRLISFEPTIVIQNGNLLVENIKRIRYSIDDMLQMLRDRDVFNIHDVEMAIIEKNGKLSVIKKSLKMHPTIEDLGMSPKNGGLAYPVIVEGQVYDEVLSHFNVNRVWLHQELMKYGVQSVEDIFYASVNRKLELHFTTNASHKKTGPPLYH